MARSTINYIYDAATAFRAPGSATVTATGVIGVQNLDKMVNTRPSDLRNKLGAEEYNIVVAVESIDRTTGDETYTFIVETGAIGSLNIEVARMSVATPGQYVLCIQAENIENLSAAREALELNLTVAGTTPIIKFSAWLV